MATREIPRDEWLEFLDSFSREHQGWLVNLEVVKPGKGTQVEANAMPLAGISVGVKQGGGDTISVMLGKAPEDHLTHTVHGVLHVKLRESDEGAHEAIEIGSKAGETTLVRFRSVVLPEMVNGILPE
jgi:Family of unknown function (DUF5335)